MQRRGGSTEDALRAAHLRFGSVAQAIEAVRDQRGLPWLEDLSRDARHAFRSFRRSPVFTALAVLTLALGIGANTAVFSIVNGVILKPLKYPRPEQLIYLSTQFRSFESGDLPVSPPEYMEFREMNRSFKAVGAFTTGEVNLTAGDRPRRVRSAFVDTDLLNALGLQTLEGRLFAMAETEVSGGAAPQQPPARPVAILSNELWQTAFGGQPILGQDVEVDGRKHKVIGIMVPESDVMDNRTELWLPLGLNPANRLNRAQHSLNVIGRLRDGVSVESAQGVECAHSDLG